MLTYDKLIAQVRRRRLIRVALLYILSAWFVVQFAYHVLPMVDLPVWIATVLLIVAVIGFPIVMLRTAAATPSPGKHPNTPAA